MGLFGYNVKDYAKNTENYKEKIQALQMKCGNEMGLRKILNTALILLDTTEFPKGKNGKQQQAIDERIAKLIDSMYRDVQQRKPAKLSSHAEMLVSAISDSRAFGEEAFDANDIAQQETMADCKSDIYDALNEKKKLAERKEALLKEGEQLQGVGAEQDMARLELEYNTCVSQEERLDEDIAAKTEIYNANLEAVNARARVKSGVQLKGLSVVNNLAEFTREVEKGTALFAEAHEKNSEILSAAREAKAEIKGMHANTASSSGFRDLTEARKNANMTAGMSNANGQSAPEKSDSPFMNALNRRG